MVTALAPSGHVPGLDGARAVATVAVFSFHALWRTPALQPLGRVLGHADIGVEFFFVLSGFLVVRPLVAHAVAGGRPVGFVDFWRKRFARIWPAYLVALGVAVALGIGTLDGVGGWLKHGLLVDSWFDDGGGDGLRVSWTLVVEVAFYAAVLPLAAVLLLAGRRRLDAWIAACLAVLAYGSWALAVTTQEQTEPWLRVLPPYLPAFALGMLLAVAERGDARGAWLGAVVRGVRSLAGRAWLCWGLAGAALVAMILVLEPAATAPAFRLGRDRAIQSFLQVAIAGLAIAPLALRSGRAGFLASPPLERLAAASLGFFLWHITVLRGVRPLLGGSTAEAILGLAIALLGSFAAGEASRRLVESPARRLLVR
ncbi:MAG TPA: acyltransferase [Acidimicrobiales bacterium]|nr:acyltransferase [Acidimicrobiales bacterium]